MTLTITIPDNIATTVVDNICTATAYDIGSGTSKNQWAKQQLLDHIRRLNRQGAMSVAAATSETDTEPQIT